MTMQANVQLTVWPTAPPPPPLLFDTCQNKRFLHSVFGVIFFPSAHHFNQTASFGLEEICVIYSKEHREEEEI